MARLRITTQRRLASKAEMRTPKPAKTARFKATASGKTAEQNLAGLEAFMKKVRDNDQ